LSNKNVSKFKGVSHPDVDKRLYFERNMPEIAFLV